jgi:hypothetical protein
VSSEHAHDIEPGETTDATKKPAARRRRTRRIVTSVRDALTVGKAKTRGISLHFASEALPISAPALFLEDSVLSLPAG